MNRRLMLGPAVGFCSCISLSRLTKIVVKVWLEMWLGVPKAVLANIPKCHNDVPSLSSPAYFGNIGHLSLANPHPCPQPDLDEGSGESALKSKGEMGASTQVKGQDPRPGRPGGSELAS